jgi:hypothetical protein
VTALTAAFPAEDQDGRHNRAIQPRSSNHRNRSMLEPAAIVAFVSFATYVLLGKFVTGRM